ncbi:MAG: type II toxin-antitoxin system RelE/ParE family toxin [Bacteroidales bacterium]
MALKIQWTKRAVDSFEKIVNYIEENWSESSAKTFVQKTNKLIFQIADNPGMCPNIVGKEVKRGVITRQTSLYYRVMNGVVRLITFWDNRRNPKKLRL